MPSVESLCELLEDLSHGPGVPPDALYAQLNPWVAADGEAGKDHEMLLASLSSLARRGDEPLLSHLTSLAIGYLGGKEGFHALTQLVLDDDLPAVYRESAADAISKHHSEELSPHSQVFDACMLLQTQRVLRLVADGNSDARAMLDSILENTSQQVGMREAIEPLVYATKTADIPLVNVWGDIVVSLEDDELRRDLIGLIARDRRVESAEFLAALEGQTTDKEERKELRKHIHVLRGHGVKVPAKASKPREGSVIAFGVDGDACASLFFFVPERMGGTLISFVIHLTSGIRDAFVRDGLSWSDVQEDKRSFLEQSDLAGAIPFAEGLRLIQHALAQTPQGVLRSSDVAGAVAKIKPLFLSEIPEALPLLSDVPSPTDEKIRKLLETEPFGYWFFESVEATMVPILEKLVEGVSLGEQPRPGTELEKRFEKATDDFLLQLVATGERARVSAMLRHQAMVLSAAGKLKDSALCARMSEDLLAGNDTFLRAMAARSLLWAMNQVDEGGDEWARRYDPCHDGLKQVMQDSPGEVTKQQIAHLDLGAQIATVIVMRNRRLPSSLRAGLHSLETAAFAMADVFLENQGEGEGATAEQFEEILQDMQLMPQSERAGLAKQALHATNEFVQRRCGSCAHECLKFPGGAAEGLLFAMDKPWEVPVSAVVGKSRKKGYKPQAQFH
jgi:hypothetical protein